MARKRKVEAQVAARELVERVAYIMGPGSAAQAALDDAAAHGGPVRFWMTPGAWVVEKLPAVPPANGGDGNERSGT